MYYFHEIQLCRICHVSYFSSIRLEKGEWGVGGEKQTPLNKCKKQKALDKNKQFHTHYVSPGLFLAATNSVSSQ